MDCRGCGSIGGAIGGALHRAGESVVLVARNERLAALNANGLRWRGEHWDETLAIPAHALDAVTPRPGDVLCVATKLQDAESVLDTLAAAWGDVPVVCLTNGLLGDEWAMERFERVVGSVVWLAASCPDAHSVALWGSPVTGRVLLAGVQGDVSDVTQRMADALSRGDIPTEHTDHIWACKRAKWVGNLAGGAQALVVEHDWMAVAQAAMTEGRAVFAAAKQPVAADADLRPVGPYSLITLDGRTRDGGSTRQSLLAGKSLETRWLNGPIVALGQSLGVATPVNEALVAGALRAEREGWREPRLAAADVVSTPSSR